jgi:hypothetical protein
MKEDWSDIEKNRRKHYAPYPDTKAGDRYGWFEFFTPHGDCLHCLVVAGDPLAAPDSHDAWDHVSVTLTERGRHMPTRLPSWREMCYVKSRFWEKSETVVQFHPMESAYVNDNEFVLHLWKKAGVDYELPPNKCV